MPIRTLKKAVKMIKEAALKKTQPITRITVKYDIGFGNELFLRGHGSALSWDKGIRMKNVKHDEWIWETHRRFSNCEFKVLINDQQYECGENHALHCGHQIQYTPHFFSS
jgi:hypothetical protein